MSAITHESVIEAARRWIEGDPDEATRTELRALVDAGDTDELVERMAGSLEFGTAGLRGKVEAGSNRMNRAVVIRTTRGLADWLLRDDPDDKPLVVVGYDARLSSRTFMDDTVGVLVAAGIEVTYFDSPVPTPLVAFVARANGAEAAVVITASHNPPQDNGYKVYASNGAQIVPPTDVEIAAAIDRVGPAVAVPRVEGATGGAHPLARPVADDFFERYLSEVAEIRPEVELDQDLSIVYTPMHGVGGRYVVEALQHFGYRGVRPVEAQFTPDGHFPTVAFPNPEEPGALDLATELAQTAGADLIIANDPDTDRLAVSVERADGAWRPLTGNQIGVLLADFLLEYTTEPSPIVLQSIVSSPMLVSIADEHEAHYDKTLTGFKWIWNAALDLEEAGKGRYVFGFEEALGYSAGPIVRDKDGIGAAVLFADLAAACKARGSSVLKRLESLYHRHGLWVSTQKSIVREGTEGGAEIAGAMTTLEERAPAGLGEWTVTEVVDYRKGADTRPRYLPATDLVILELEPNGRVLIRPSGTEPKIKIYVDLRSDVGTDQDVWALERRLIQQGQEIASDLARFVGLG